MSKQCLSIEQMKHLQELGLDISKASCFYDIHIPTNSSELFWEYEEYKEDSNDVMFEAVPTFTLQDILDLLPKDIITNDTHMDNVRLALDFWNDSFGYAYYFETCGELSFYKRFYCERGHLLIDAAYELLCWCIENEYVETNK